MSAVLDPLAPADVPAAICARSAASPGTRALEIRGSGFVALPADLLDRPRVVLPRLLLEGPAAVEVAPERVGWAGPAMLLLDVAGLGDPPGPALAPGDYALRVRNPDGGEAVAEGALRVIAPPRIASVLVEDDGDGDGRLCVTLAQTLVVRGSGFRPGSSVTLRTVQAERAFPAELRGADAIAVQVPAGTFEPRDASAPASVEVATAEGCLAVPADGAAPPEVDLEVGCQAGGAAP